MNYQNLQLAHNSGIATITLNRPEKRNALSFQLVDELLAALDEIKQSSSQVLILTGAGKAFCAGMDLDGLKSLVGKTHQENIKDSERIAQLFRRVYDFPLPTIAAVNGAAIAGGTGLATMCDFTLAVPNAKFGYTEVRIGFVPAIVSSMLVWQVGHKIARDLLLSGRTFDADDAHRFGLVNEVVEPERLMQRANELASELALNSPSSMQATKKLINGFIFASSSTSKLPRLSKTTHASAPPKISAKASHPFWRNANQSGAVSDFSQASHLRNSCARALR